MAHPLPYNRYPVGATAPIDAGVHNMQQKPRSPVLACTVLMFSLALSGCGSASKADDRGQSAALAWPDIAQATRSQGSYPDPAYLARVKVGMNKHQVYDGCSARRISTKASSGCANGTIYSICARPPAISYASTRCCSIATAP